MCVQGSRLRTSLTDWLLCLQTLRCATRFLHSVPKPLPPHTPPSFRDMVTRVRDLTAENSPFDPVVLMALAPPCLRTHRLVFLFAPSPPASPLVVILTPDCTSRSAPSTGFLLLHKRHAWALDPPAFASSSASFASWVDSLHSANIPVQTFPLLGWRN